MTPRRSRRFEPKPNPFDGANPFADDSTAPVPHSENPLAASVTDEVQPFKAVEYEQTLSDRSYRIMVQAIVGAALIGVGLVVVLVVALNSSLWATEIIYGWPADLLGLAFCIPAWVMARADLRAIKAGAMDDRGRRRTQIAYWCGSIGTLVGAFPFMAAVAAIILSIFS